MFSLSFYKFVTSIHVILHSDTEYKPLPPPRHNKAAMLLSHLICRMLMFCLFFVFIYIYWCPIYTMMSVSLSSNTVGVTSNTETAYPSGTPEFTSGFQCSVLQIIVCPFSLFLSAIVLSGLRLTVSALFLVDFMLLNLPFSVQCFIDH